MTAMALIYSGKVTNIVEVDPNEAASIFPDAILYPVDSKSIFDIGWFYDGTTFTPPPVVYPTQDEIVTAVQEYLDSVAKTHNYDGILSLCSYAVSTNNLFKAEGMAGIVWRDSVWTYCYKVLADVQAGTRTIPTIPKILAELPTMTWGV